MGEGDRMSEHAARSSPVSSLRATERTVAMSAMEPHSGAAAAPFSAPSPGIDPGSSPLEAPAAPVHTGMTGGAVGEEGAEERCDGDECSQDRGELVEEEDDEEAVGAVEERSLSRAEPIVALPQWPVEPSGWRQYTRGFGKLVPLKCRRGRTKAYAWAALVYPDAGVTSVGDVVIWVHSVSEKFRSLQGGRDAGHGRGGKRKRAGAGAGAGAVERVRVLGAARVAWP